MDGVTAAEYEQDLEGNLRRLLDRAKSGHVPGTAGATGAHSERRFHDGDSPDRNSDAGGQGPSACGRHVAGADL